MANNQGDSMDIDIDIDIDLGDEPTMEEFATISQPVEVQSAPIAPAASSSAVPAAYDSDVDKTEIVDGKVHIRGLDNLTTADVKQFVEEHCGLDNFEKLEWVDDTSANIVCRTADSGLQVLENLSVYIPGQESSSTAELRRAKQLSSHPDAQLYVRQAYKGDVKAPRAREASRFYLMNPDHDPAQRYDGRYQRGRGGRGGRGGDRRRQYSDRPFDDNLYGADRSAAKWQRYEADRRQSNASMSSDHSRHGRKLVRYEDDDEEEDLISKKPEPLRLRDRSASPIRDGDGRYGFEDNQPARKTARHRSRTPPPRRRDLEDMEVENSRKELFPTRPSRSALDTPIERPNAGIELFPTPSSHSKRNRELFPNRTPHSNHRRSDALDRDETKVLIATASGGDLASRITGGPNNGSNGFKFAGAAAATENSEFSIRGASREMSAKVKELFPLTARSNSGKELFADKLQGRGTQRRRAEDLF